MDHIKRREEEEEEEDKEDVFFEEGVVVVYVVVFRDWIFGYERWLCLDDDLFSIGCKARLALT